MSSAGGGLTCSRRQLGWRARRQRWYWRQMRSWWARRLAGCSHPLAYNSHLPTCDHLLLTYDHTLAHLRLMCLPARCLLLNLSTPCYHFHLLALSLDSLVADVRAGASRLAAATAASGRSPPPLRLPARLDPSHVQSSPSPPPPPPLRLQARLDPSRDFGPTSPVRTMHSYACTCATMHMNTCAHMRTCACTCTHARMHACTHARMHTCTHMHTHAHMHTLMQVPISWPCPLGVTCTSDGTSPTAHVSTRGAPSLVTSRAHLVAACSSTCPVRRGAHAHAPPTCVVICAHAQAYIYKHMQVRRRAIRSPLTIVHTCTCR